MDFFKICIHQGDRDLLTISASWNMYVSHGRSYLHDNYKNIPSNPYVNENLDILK